MAITSAFQADDAGSIPAVRSSPYFHINTSGVHTLKVPHSVPVGLTEPFTHSSNNELYQNRKLSRFWIRLICQGILRSSPDSQGQRLQRYSVLFNASYICRVLFKEYKDYDVVVSRGELRKS